MRKYIGYIIDIHIKNHQILFRQKITNALYWSPTVKQCAGNRRVNLGQIRDHRTIKSSYLALFSVFWHFR